MPVMDNIPPPASTPAPFPSTPPPAPVKSSDERNWCMWCHLSALAGFLVPFGNILGPLIIWQMKRNEFPAINDHGKEALNFQLAVVIYMLGGGILSFLLVLSCIGAVFLPVVILALMAIHFGALVLAIVAGIKSGEGTLYRYPLTLRLIK
jgi:uncharacterized Tic20 family protein